MKRRMTAFLIALILLSCTLPVMVAADGKYVASKNSDVFHKPDCSYVSSIKERNKIWFDSLEEALASGRHGCSRCKPDSGISTENSLSGTLDRSSNDSSLSSNYKAGYNKGYDEGYGVGEDIGYDSGYSAGEKAMKVEMEGLMAEKIADAKSDASLSAYLTCLFFGAPVLICATCAFVGKARDKTEEQLRKQIEQLRKQTADSKQALAQSVPEKPKLPSKSKRSSGAVQVSSSCISTVEYHDNAIYIQFKTGGKFCYYNVPQKIYQDLLDAPSKGKYYHQNIEGLFPCAPVE